MFGSLVLGRVFGIPLRVHWLLVALLVFVALSSQSPVATLLYLVVLMVVVGLHELGHCLMARRFGVSVLDITFWPLGGMARMSDMPEDTRAEVSIALAGPAVNAVLALGSLVLLVPLLGAQGLHLGELVDMFLARRALPPGSPLLAASLLLLAFFSINAMLGLFNLVPAFPMDGGRVLRALLGRKRDWVAATERAVSVSRWIAGAMFLAGFLGQGLRFLPFIAIFVWFSGTRELWSVRLRHGRMPFGASAADPRTSRTSASPRGPALENLFDLFGTRTSPNGQRSDGAQDAQILEPDSPPEPSAGEGPDGHGARRPRAWTYEPGPQGERWTDEKLAELERFRGRLPRP